jgi:hypothetical protein
MALVTTNSLRVVVRQGRYNEATIVHHPLKNNGPMLELKLFNEPGSLFIGFSSEEIQLIKDWIISSKKGEDMIYYCSCGKSFNNSGDLVIHFSETNAAWPNVTRNDEHRQVSLREWLDITDDKDKEDEEEEAKPTALIWGEDISIVPKMEEQRFFKRRRSKIRVD